MQHSAKYIIHGDIRTSGVVERSDVVGAIFGQTEGLLGEDMDLRDLQDASKVGRIDVDIDSEGGRSFGTIRIASGMDRAETAVLAAALETIERVGPCRAECSIITIEDARAAKRRNIVDRATELLAAFEDEQLTGDRLVEEVRERVRESEITEYHGLPAGPRVADSDAVIIVEGRADVRKLLAVGIRNAVGVEGTDIPDAVARLTNERTTTAFLDGDRGGDLILRELAQVGEIDFVAFAPAGQSVEELDRTAIMAALRKKLPYEQVSDGASPREAFAPTDGGTVEPIPEEQEPEAAPAQTEEPAETAPTTVVDRPDTDGDTSVDQSVEEVAEPNDPGAATQRSETETDEMGPAAEPETASDELASDEGATSSEEITDSGPLTLGGHVAAVIEKGCGTVRLLDEDGKEIDSGDATAVGDVLDATETVPQTIILDDTVSQRILDIATQRGVERIIGRELGEFVKQPAGVRVYAADEIDIE